MFDLNQIQLALREFQLDGWLLYDFRGLNVLAHRVLDIRPDSVASRRFAYFIPAVGDPKKLVHRIELASLDHLPGEKVVYLKWQELESGLEDLCRSASKIAMEYSPRNGNPYVSRVDGGTIELIKSFGKEIVSSGDLIQYFEARWSPSQWQLHLQADVHTRMAFELAWEMIAKRTAGGGSVTESEVQSMIMDHFHTNGMTTYHPPIVGVNENSGDPHYEPFPGKDRPIRENDFVLIDLWAKMDVADGVYSDLTKVGFVGDSVPQSYEKVFRVVADARDAGIAIVKDSFENGKCLYGWQVDQATRDVIQAAGYGDYFVHRTGHNIGQETHGNGAHMDNLETQEDRTVMRQTCFSIEPGIYLPEFGIRSEVDVYVDENGKVWVTGGVQNSVHPILAGK
ncbi:MAG: M24 family metallopeptidase [Pirellulaceae bacterium]|nr:M24 family metallopeptidase [Pirellulaceae bacterium]